MSLRIGSDTRTHLPTLRRNGLAEVDGDLLGAAGALIHGGAG